MRHGARQTTLKSQSGASFHQANLTNPGFAQMAVLGNRMAKKYARELGLHKYDPREVRVVSSDPNRCMFSGRAWLYGYFWRKSGERHTSYLKERRVNQKVFWEVDPEVGAELSEFAVTRLAGKENLLFRAHHPKVCPKMKGLRSKRGYLRSKELEEYADLVMQKLKEEGFDIESVVRKDRKSSSKIGALFEYFYTLHFAVPKGEEPISRKLFRMLNIAKMHIWFLNKKGTANFSNIALTPLLKAVHKDITKGRRDSKKPKSKKREKLVVYSGHASTILSLMELFNLTNPKCIAAAVHLKKAGPKKGEQCFLFPKFGAYFAFVLKVENKMYHVDVFYRQKLVMTKTYPEFLSLLSSLWVKDFDKKCSGKRRKPKKTNEDVASESMFRENDVIIGKKEREEFRNEKLKERKYRKNLLIQILEGYLGERVVEIGLFAFFCGALFISFKYIYARFAIKQKLKHI